ncbi:MULTISPECIES: hypothetical protein [Corynebacterium]|uniref:hypothetical protein n=1 Tax=Corynebacterium TaxID=1716 RepID=UPI00124E8508|nr:MULTISPECIES: hypothetical protein [Corynebacterium]
MENYLTIVNSYAPLWSEYKEVDSPITPLDVTQRFLEQYFLQLWGYDGADLKMTLVKNHRDTFIRVDEQGNEDHSKTTLYGQC